MPGSLDRVDNAPLYQKWLDEASGYDRADVEVVKRTLRVVSRGVPSHSPAPSHWTWGTGPLQRAAAPGDGVVTNARPAAFPPMTASVAPPAPAVAPSRPVAAAVAPAASVVAAASPAAAARPAATAPPAAPAVVAVVAPPPGAPAAKSGEQLVRDKILQIVAEKTGYPPDMLDMDLDLEADLGVDTVKQAETFAAVREAYDIQRQDNLRLRDFPTMRHVVGFVLSNRPEFAPSPAVPASASQARPTAAPASASQGHAPTALAAALPAAAVSPPGASGPSVPAAIPASGSDAGAAKVLQIVAEKTGYPPDMLDMDLDLEADLGVDTVKQAETFAAVRERSTSRVRTT